MEINNTETAKHQKLVKIHCTLSSTHDRSPWRRLSK